MGASVKHDRGLDADTQINILSTALLAPFSCEIERDMFVQAVLDERGIEL